MIERAAGLVAVVLGFVLIVQADGNVVVLLGGVVLLGLGLFVSLLAGS